MKMKKSIKIFKSKRFEVICEEKEIGYIDDNLLGVAVSNAADNGNCVITHVKSRVFWGNAEIGYASMSNCVHSNLCEERGIFIMDRRYCYEVARRAIREARENLAEVQDDLPDLYLRKTASS